MTATDTKLLSRMMGYAWFDADGNKGETKFGDHFVTEPSTLAEAIEHTRRYIKHHQFPRRGPHFESGRVQFKIWDISEYAKYHNKFRISSSIDDVIRPAIGSYGTVGKEFHTCSLNDVIIRVNTELSRIGQPLTKAHLSTMQYNVASEVIDKFNSGSTVVLAELCARFGKTIWSGAVAKELDADLVVVASYVKTVFTSFAKDLTSFQQFAEYVHVDCGNADFQDTIITALENGKKVIAYLSMANGGKRQAKIDYLFSWDVNTLLIVDEADFGSHTAKQADALIEATAGTVKTIIMTGTNSDRAATHWAIDDMISVTYPELLIQKRETENA